MIHDIDPQMRYCPKCKEEYEPEFASCGVCGQTLLWGSEMLAGRQGHRPRLSAPKPLTAGDDLVTVFKAPLAELKRLERQLRAESIPALIQGDGPSCGQGCCGGGEMELLVRRGEVSAALAVIEADFEQQTAGHGAHSAVADYGFDPGRGENRCPACGASFPSHALTGGGMNCPDCGLCFG